MAKFRPILGQIIKSIAGITFTQNGNQGAAIRQRPKPPTQYVEAQTKNRARIGYLSRAWRDLTAAQKQLWKDYAATHPITDGFGDPLILSGSNWYTSLNTTALKNGDAAVLSPPAVAPAATLATLVPSDGVVDGAIVLTWTVNGTGSASDLVEIQVSSALQGNGIQNYHGTWRSETPASGDAVTATVIGLGVDFYYYLRARYVDQYGQKTAWLRVEHQAPDVP